MAIHVVPSAVHFTFYEPHQLEQMHIGASGQPFTHHVTGWACLTTGKDETTSQQLEHQKKTERISRDDITQLPTYQT